MRTSRFVPGRKAALWTIGLAMLLDMPPLARAQIIQQEVAGVAVDAGGVLRNVERDKLGALRRARQEALLPVAGELGEMASLRKISLRRLEAAIEKQLAGGGALPDEMKYLAGLQRIRYVFVYPEQHDIVLAGPGEGWTANAQGEVVGNTTGAPVMLLDDLLVALRSAEAARQSGISCSIDPTPDGLERLRTLVKGMKTMGDRQKTVDSIEQTLGLQTISVTGISAESHFAQVIVAADYKMKRLAMNFDEAPVRNMPSYMDMISAGSRGMQNMMPRWWLAPDYDSLLADENGLAWEIRRASVKAMAEEDLLVANGQREHTGKAGAMARKWAQSMSTHYEELAKADAAFGQLRNCIDLAVVSALIAKERLTDKAGYSMPLLTDDARLTSMRFNAPRQVPSQASVLRKGRNWLISASGGVQIEPWSIVDKREAASLAPARAQAAAANGARWWWN